LPFAGHHGPAATDDLDALSLDDLDAAAGAD